MGARLACIFFALSVGGASGCSTEPSVAGDQAASQVSDAEKNDGKKCRKDVFEKNDTVDDAATLAFDPVFPQQAFVRVDATLCAGEEDWFLIPTSTLPWETVTVRLQVFAADAGFCADFGCDGFLPTPGPEHTVTVEAYHAVTGTLLGSSTDDQGIVRIYGSTEWGDDVLIRVSGPPEAEYPYLLRFATWSFEGEDECEC
jgi:hypothetical protein